MRFSAGLAAAVLAPLLSVRAEDFLINVGENGTLTFTPSNIIAKAGDTVAFMFMSKNHSVTQSTFAAPCVKSGIDSDFQNVPDGQNTQLPQFSFNVSDSTTPLWFFCAQTNPAVHCAKGMVFSVNADPNSAKSFAAFQAAAMGGAAPTNGSSSAAPGSGSGSSSSTGSGSSPGGAAPTDGSSSSGSGGSAPSNGSAPDATGAPGSQQSAPGAGFRAAPSTAAALFLAGVVLAWL